MKGSRKTLEYVPRWLVGIGDVFLVNAGFALAFVIRFGLDVPQVNVRPFIETLPWVSGLTALLFLGLGLYEKRLNGFFPVFRSLITGVVLIVLSAMVLTFWFREFAFPRSVLILGGFCQIVLLVLWRWLVWHGDRLLYGQRTFALIGPAADVETIAGKLLELPRDSVRIAKVVELNEGLDLKAELTGMDGVLVAPSVPRELKAEILNACIATGQEVYLVPDLYDVAVSNARVGQIDDLPVMQIQDIRLSGFQAFTKRGLDLVAALAGLLVFAPVMLVAAVLVAVTSKGPVIYTQQRVGQFGREFSIYKFRTMVADAEKVTGPVLAAENDPRVTPVGRFLRATRLDELPQLFNILKSDMSLVGPRPERPFFVEQFEKANPEYRYRYLVKPGITGLAQVYSRYTTSAEDKLRYDLYYIRNYSLLLDLRIILQTIPILLHPAASRGSKESTVQRFAGLLAEQEKPST
ncbi:sugar transferase [Desulforudis sp. DRI-14]|uniref:sugar transferase n=1 Tax=Desulforudis sp. DRI-14 TaxID=3459793 RepID=UPI0040417BAF